MDDTDRRMRRRPLTHVGMRRILLEDMLQTHHVIMPNRALSLGRALCVCGAVFAAGRLGWLAPAPMPIRQIGEMTVEEAMQLG